MTENHNENFTAPTPAAETPVAASAAAPVEAPAEGAVGAPVEGPFVPTSEPVAAPRASRIPAWVTQRGALTAAAAALIFLGGGGVGYAVGASGNHDDQRFPGRFDRGGFNPGQLPNGQVPGNGQAPGFQGPPQGQSQGQSQSQNGTGSSSGTTS